MPESSRWTLRAPQREVIRFARARRYRIPAAAFALSALRWPEVQHFIRRAGAWLARRRVAP